MIDNISMPKDFPKELLEVGYRLDSLGIIEFAWKKNDVLKVIDFLTSKGYAILGGDVYMFEKKEISSTYDNWYINKSKSKNFIEKSKERALDYIKEYSKQHGETFLYSIVFELI